MTPHMVYIFHHYCWLCQVMGDRDTHYHKDTLPPNTSFKQLITKLLSLVNCDEFIISSLDSNKLGYTTKLKHNRLIPDTWLITFIKCTIKRLTLNCPCSPCKMNKNRTMSCKHLHMVSVTKMQIMSVCLMGQIKLHVLMAQCSNTCTRGGTLHRCLY